MPCNITTPAILSVQTGLASSGARHAAARGIPHEKETKLQSFPRLEQGPEYHSFEIDTQTIYKDSLSVEAGSLSAHRHLTPPHGLAHETECTESWYAGLQAQFDRASRKQVREVPTGAAPKRIPLIDRDQSQDLKVVLRFASGVAIITCVVETPQESCCEKFRWFVWLR
ncbi:hypothetical protein HZ326_0997 [Fusarium oxysporum f. sp. albedinis]|nr:hypothetical protein HZ326_0997 [Fusarium oxysporum f. sp. albedinis]